MRNAGNLQGMSAAKVPMLAAQGMKAVANLFHPDAPAPETLDRPLPAPGGNGYPRDGKSAGSRILAAGYMAMFRPCGVQGLIK